MSSLTWNPSTPITANVHQSPKTVGQQKTASTPAFSTPADSVTFGSLDKLKQRTKSIQAARLAELREQHRELLAREVFPAIPGVCEAFSHYDLLVALSEHKGTLEALKKEYKLDDNAMGSSIIRLREAGLLTNANTWSESARLTTDAELLLEDGPPEGAPTSAVADTFSDNRQRLL